MSNASARGRADLAAWQGAQPDNFYEAAKLLRLLNEQDWTREQRDRFTPGLRHYGQVVAGALDRVVAENNQAHNLPRMAGWDGIGQPGALVAHHPAWHQAGRLIYRSGVMSAYDQQPTPHRYILSLFYLSSHVGEAGHNCPLACTAGAIRVLQNLGTKAQKERYLDRLLDPDFDQNYTAAQFLTEVQGGSDVGANACVAEPQPDGSWRISGEKWFCSNVDADVFVMSARPTGNPTGTRGLSMFLVPAMLENGRRNHFRLRRLKDKLGTRSMASGELDFEGAVAEAVGPVSAGFVNMMTLVINTSRLYNAFGCAGVAQRSYLVASGYAQHRRAFGQAIANYPLVQETLALMLADTEASLAGSWLLAGLQERIDQGLADQTERGFFRVALNLNKMRTAQLAHDAVCRGIEVLGGNGAIESFSILPRLLRDNVVYENWEGTHNTLMLQVLRDCQRFELHRAFFSWLGERLDAALLDAPRAALHSLLALPNALATLQLRPVCKQLATLVHLAALAPVQDEEIRARASLTQRHHLDGFKVPDAAYLELVGQAWQQ
jgi:alkylation response protein AidB-like acyl-CoA dehydrogenase